MGKKGAGAGQKSPRGGSPRGSPKSAPKKAAVEEVPPITAETASAEEEVDLTPYDLTARISPFLDRHLIIHILNFLREARMYEEKDLVRAEIALLTPTNMIDFIAEKYEAVGETAPNALLARREQVLEELSETRLRCLPLLEMLEDEDKVKKIASYKNSAELCQDMNLDMDAVTNLLQFAKIQFDCGAYKISGEILKRSSNMVGDSTKQVSCLWGALASSLLTEESDDAANLIIQLDGILEESRMAKKDLMVQRTWLLHWTLFAIFTPEKVDPRLFDFFLNEKNLIIISLCCPHILRYVSSVLILQKRLKHMMKDVVRFVTAESASYSDPVTRFLLALYSDMDFDEAQGELQKCKSVCKADFFLNKQWNDFEENARLLIFETYCRIHQCINIGMIASRLNMKEEEAELWIVKLIQNAKLEARIDSAKSRVVMSKAPPSVYQQVIEKTKNLSFRSTMLLSNLMGDKERNAANANAAS